MKEYKINEIPYKRILGRTNYDDNSKNSLALFWNASALEINVKTAEVWIKVSANYNNAEPWIAVKVNGNTCQRFMVTSKEPVWICISRFSDKSKENLITMMKDTQPIDGDLLHSLFIHEVALSDDGEFVQLQKRPLKIEFIGDSITSGEGLYGGVNDMDWIPQWIAVNNTYAMQTAINLNADWSFISQCGWGICWGWDGNRYNEIPSNYDYICSVMKGEYQEKLGVKNKYDFGNGFDVIVINLGTNDNGAFFQPPWKDENGKEHILSVLKNKKASKEDGQKIIDGVLSFLKKIRSYNPNAKIIWCFGMLELKTVPPLIKKGLKDYKKLSCDKNVYLLKLDSMEKLEKNIQDKGSRGHPGPKTHRKAADRLTTFIKKIS